MDEESNKEKNQKFLKQLKTEILHPKPVGYSKAILRANFIRINTYIYKEKFGHSKTLTPHKKNLDIHINNNTPQEIRKTKNKTNPK